MDEACPDDVRFSDRERRLMIWVDARAMMGGRRRRDANDAVEVFMCTDARVLTRSRDGVVVKNVRSESAMYFLHESHDGEREVHLRSRDGCGE
jgi:hypothetical protein